MTGYTFLTATPHPNGREVFVTIPRPAWAHDRTYPKEEVALIAIGATHCRHASTSSALTYRLSNARWRDLCHLIDHGWHGEYSAALYPTDPDCRTFWHPDGHEYRPREEALALCPALPPPCRRTAALPLAA